MSAGKGRAIRIVSIGAACLFAATGAGCKKRVEAPPQGPLSVNVVTAEEKEVTEYDEFTGRMEAVYEVEIRPRVSGYLESINFQAGALVKAGDLMFVIDPRPYQADLDRATADLERAQS